MTRRLFFILAIVCLAAPRSSMAQERGASALGGLVQGLGMTPRVLMIGAHPDDEDTRLIAWLARGRHVETAYLALTRGDGGQNLIGNELGEALGIIRTEELLAARRVDGGHQYFTRAYDFGFSKTADEAFSHWPHDSVLGDVVKIVRAFRPQVIVSVFSGTPRDGHGQHQVAGIVAREAFDAAADTVRFPVARFGAAWTPLKLYEAARFRREDATLSFDVGAYDPLLGRTYAEIAGESRSQHKSQGFGVLQRKGSMMDYVALLRSRVSGPSGGAKERSLFDGVDTTWTRLRAAVASRGTAAARAALDSLPAAVDAAQRAMNLVAPATMVPSLVRVRRLLDAVAAGASRDLDVERTLADGRDRANRAILLALGIDAEATTSHSVVATGDSARAQLAIYDQGARDVRVVVERDGRAAADTVPVAAGSALIDTLWIHAPSADAVMANARRATSGSADAAPSARAHALASGDGAADDSHDAHASDLGAAGGALLPYNPWWLVRPRAGDLFSVPVTGRAEDALPAGMELHAAVLVDGVSVPLTVPVVHQYADPVLGEIDDPLVDAPAISVTLDRTAEYAAAGAALDRTIRVTLRSASPEARRVTVRVVAPSGLRADSAARTVQVSAFGETHADFRLTGRLPAGSDTVRVVAESDGARYESGYVPISYPHIRPQKLYRPASLVLDVVDLALPRGLTVAYIPGVGDNVAPTLEQLGIPVTVIDPADVASADLSAYRAVVIGPRAYEAHVELAQANPHLFAYVRSGGTLVVQYGQYEMTAPGMMPYPITLARPHDRVTDENAAVTILDPSARVLTAPNAITPADFDGWVQERSLYMPHTFASEYTPVLSMHDPGEPPNQGAVLLAHVGEGMYVYTTLSFFRQLPAGNPGAARLFVNLLAAGSAASAPTP
ncbi:MAG TPA: PIG-L family deacetylase [Gemmatimonadaceae bacterium]|nr:PIG-L family deacetylase [Gemmatimonadaceae bacterium]